MCTLRCGGDLQLVREREACGPCRKSALRSWRSVGNGNNTGIIDVISVESKAVRMGAAV